MSAIYHVSRDSMWWQKAEYGKLKYTVENNKAIFQDDMIEQETGETSKKERVNYYDVKDIDVRNCTFVDFCKALSFADESVKSLDFDESLLKSLGEDLDTEKVMDCWTWIDDCRYDCAKRGDIQMYHKVLPMVQAAYSMLSFYDNGPRCELTEDGFLAENKFPEGGWTGFCGSYRLSDYIFNIGSSSYQAYAEFDVDSTQDNPIVLVSFVNFNTLEDIEGKYTVDIKNIDFKNATPVEIFAYLGYSSAMQKDGWEKDYNYAYAFNMLMDSGVMDIDSFSDFTDKTFNLLEVTRKAKEEMEKRVKEGGVDRRGQKFEVEWPQEVIEELRQYFKKCIETFDDLLLAIGDSEETE